MSSGALADVVRAAAARQNTAAVARDPIALKTASVAFVNAAWRAPRPGIPVRAAELYDRLVGSLLLIGQGPTAANALRAAASRQVHGGEMPLRNVPEAEWRIDELSLLVELRFLAGDWRGLPGMPGRTDQRALGPIARRRLRHAHAFLAAFAARDALSTGKTIAALGRDDRASFSLLAYALFREARNAGLAVTVPRKYNF